MNGIKETHCQGKNLPRRDKQSSQTDEVHYLQAGATIHALATPIFPWALRRRSSFSPPPVSLRHYLDFSVLACAVVLGLR